MKNASQFLTRGLVMLALASATTLTLAQMPPKLEPVPDEAPSSAPIRKSDNTNDAAEPTVTIRQEGDNKIEEFRINGRHYATRVTPKNGKPYVLTDPDGKGHMSPADDTPALLRPPQWTLFQF